MTIYFVDLETLGLDSDSPIVEIGILALSDNLRRVIGTFERLINVSPAAWRQAPGPVIEMHQANGLRDDLSAGKGVSRKTAQVDAYRFLAKHGGNFPVRGWRWGGSGVNHFDSGVLAHQWPDFRALLYYRADYDVSAPRGFAELAGRTDLPDVSHLTAHRALDDCQISWAQAKWILDILRPADVV